MKEKRVKVFFELFVRKDGKSPFSGPFPHESEVQFEVLTSRIMGIIRLSSIECCELSKIFEVVLGRHSEPARHFEGFLKGGFFVFAGYPAKNRRVIRAVLNSVRRKFKNPPAHVRGAGLHDCALPFLGVCVTLFKSEASGGGLEGSFMPPFVQGATDPSKPPFLTKMLHFGRRTKKNGAESCCSTLARNSSRLFASRPDRLLPEAIAGDGQSASVSKRRFFPLF